MDKAKVTEAVEKGEIVGALQDALKLEGGRAIVIMGTKVDGGMRIDVSNYGFAYWYEAQGMMREAMQIIDDIEGDYEADG